VAFQSKSAALQRAGPLHPHAVKPPLAGSHDGHENGGYDAGEAHMMRADVESEQPH